MHTHVFYCHVCVFISSCELCTFCTVEVTRQACPEALHFGLLYTKKIKLSVLLYLWSKNVLWWSKKSRVFEVPLRSKQFNFTTTYLNYFKRSKMAALTTVSTFNREEMDEETYLCFLLVMQSPERLYTTVTWRSLPVACIQSLFQALV